MNFKVLVTPLANPAGKEYLLEKGYEVKIASGVKEEDVIKDLEDCDAALITVADYSARALEQAKKLKVIARHGVGLTCIDVEKATELGIWVSITALANANTVAEHTIYFILSLARRATYIENAFKNGDFEIRYNEFGMDLEGKTLGLVGIGRIGNLVAKKAAGLGMKIIGYDPFIDKDKVIDDMEFVDSMDDIFKNADFVSLHLPGSDKTKGMINMNYFKMMKPTAYIINCSRGININEKELIQALQNKVIAGAALDVFEQEPPEKDNPLFSLDNVILTPHNAGISSESSVRMAVHAAMEIDRVLKGDKPQWPVNNPKLLT